MKTILCGSIFAVSSFVAFGAPVFSETFGYPDGALLGQGTPAWTITGTSVINPLQVSSGAVPLANNGQDAYRGFDTAITPVNGTTFYYGLTLNVSAAGTGDLFVHTTPTLGNTSNFYSRLYAQASGSGYVLGYLETAGGAGAAVNYGTTILNFNTAYNVSVAYDFVAGTLNDTARVYVDPTSTTELDNTPYISDTWGSTSPEATSYVAFNLRQGSAASSPTLSVDNIAVSTVFAEVAQVQPVPEPSTFALLGLGGVAACMSRRLRKK